MGGNKMVRRRLLGAVALGTMMMGTPAGAEPAARRFDLAAQDLGQALRSVARETGREVMVAADSVKGRRSPELHGDYTADQAIEALLLGSGLIVETREGVLYVRGRSEAAPDTGGPADGAQIVVTGSRIRGAESPSPMMTVTQTEMLQAGHSNLGDVIRTLTQNFGGGQNPGVGVNVPLGNGIDITGGNSLNLRGLGSDATLTLLNGHRLVYGSNRQSVDLSTIPLQAVERMEILADGASALYGSDAVAGVANVVLKRDYEGVASTVEVGAATDGGYVRQHYNLLAGTRWSSGGILVTYDFSSNTAILARHRGYTATRSPGLTLYPRQRQHNLLASGHQQLAPGLDFSFDATFGRRFSTKSFLQSAAARAPTITNPSRGRAFSLAPRLELALGDWRIAAQGVIGTDNVTFDQLSTASGTQMRTTRACYCNHARSFEISGDGLLFSIAGNPAKIALGAGYRYNRFRSYYIPAANGPNIKVGQDIYYAFGELSVPLVSPESDLPLVRRLTFNAAMRIEDYPGVDRVATPKFGLIYAPSSGLELKATWGKSFKAPTLFQQYSDQSVILYTAASRGGVGYAPTATAIFQYGGTPDLKPERAETWSGSAIFHPATVPGLQLEATIFHIRYRDRVVAPIPFASLSLTPPYADYVQLLPSAADKAAALAGRTFFNATASAYDPANVVAIIRNSSVNAARQTIKGIDLSGRYSFTLGERDTISLAGGASYLDSKQQLTPTQPVLDLSGVLFNPPHTKARGSVSWERDGVSLSAFLTYTGGVSDERIVPAVSIDGMTTADFVARVRTSGTGLLAALDISVTIQNAFNAKPSLIRTTQIFDSPYDSTNYSPIGRYVGLSVAKQW